MIAGVIDRMGEEVTEESVRAMLERSLAWTQSDAAQRRRWVLMSDIATRGFMRTDEATRSRWVQSGLSLSSARVIDQIVTALQRQVGDEDVPNPGDALERILTGGHLPSLLGLAEHRAVKVRTRRAGRGTVRIDLDYAGLLRAWLAGESVESIAERFLNAVPDRTFRSEQLSDVIATTCEHFMPWALGVLVRWLNDMRAIDSKDDEVVMPFSPELPTCIRHGVSSADAVRLARQGVARDVAIKMADAFADAEESDLRVWLQELGIEGWVEVASPSPNDLRALIHYSRALDAAIAAKVLEGETATVPVLPVTSDLPAGHCVLAFRELPNQGTRVVVERQGELVAHVAVHHIAEVEALLATGIPLIVRAMSEVNAVEISLGGDEDTGTRAEESKMPPRSPA